MPLHIKDEAATQAVRRLAAQRNITLTDAVRVACEEALRRDQEKTPLAERIADIQNRVSEARGRARAPGKSFYDEGWGGL